MPSSPVVIRVDRKLHYVAGAIGLLLCGLMAWHAGRAGLSRLFSYYGEGASVLTAADAAVRLNPADPRAHAARAAVLSERNDWGAARQELERAVALRPQDFALWLALAQARDQVGALAGAVDAAKKATHLAPYYAEPRWQLGNLLLRAGRSDEAFQELRRATAASPSRLPQLIDLVYGLFNADPDAVEKSIQPQDATTHLALAQFFVRHGQVDAALRMFRAAGNLSKHDRQLLLPELLAADHFREAFEVWAGDRLKNHDDRAHGHATAVTNGGFEDEIQRDELGFDWQLAGPLQAVSASLDPIEPHTGARSLRLDWNGDSPPSLAVFTQRMLVEPKIHYRLSFWARTRNLVTGGRPLIVVADAAHNGRVLSPIAKLPQGTNGWQQYSIEFQTDRTTQAVLIIVRREDCSATTCPIFGQTWFDDFTLAF